MTNPNDILKAVGNVLAGYLKGFGFALLLFDLENPPGSAYVSNMDRDWMVKVLRQQADRLEQNEDEIGPVMGNA